MTRQSQFHQLKKYFLTFPRNQIPSKFCFIMNNHPLKQHAPSSIFLPTFSPLNFKKFHCYLRNIADIAYSRLLIKILSHIFADIPPKIKHRFDFPFNTWAERTNITWHCSSTLFLPGTRGFMFDDHFTNTLHNDLCLVSRWLKNCSLTRAGKFDIESDGRKKCER